jgi:hypothetical protein
MLRGLSTVYTNLQERLSVNLLPKMEALPPVLEASFPRCQAPSYPDHTTEYGHIQSSTGRSEPHAQAERAIKYEHSRQPSTGGASYHAQCTE